MSTGTDSRDARAVPPAGGRGSVLIVVLWVALGLVSLTLVFGHSMTFALRGADNDLAGREAEQAVEGAGRYARWLLANMAQGGQFPPLDTYVSENVPVGLARFWFLGRMPDALSSRTPAFGLVDECAKLNINTASRAMLEGLPGMTPELAAAILDWRDEDEQIREGGAESETYLLASPAYACKNARFETPEELLLVKGMDWALLYGEDANRNGVLDANENDGDANAPADNADGVLAPGLIEYVTVWSREPNRRADGSARVNVNQQATQLTALLRENFGEPRANEIAQRLGGGPRHDASVLEFFVRSGMTVPEFDRICDAVTVSTASFLEGLVNVNTASEAVLACLPGIDATQAAQLVAQRLAQDEPAPSVAWVAEALGAEGAVQAGPYVTARTYQVSADIAAVGRHARGYRRALLVVDFTGEAPVVVYRKDLNAAGWALGPAVYEQLALEREETR
ncbi:MAG: general secretion pathway protein GspK [Kiritimatiellae bacterium]|nr:general secretion pathway protein GspK [Kiritimatiellia bacterium]